MAILLGKKTIKRRIKFQAEADLGETVTASFVVEFNRANKKTSKSFSLLFSRFADVLSQGVNDNNKKSTLSAEAFTGQVDTAEAELAEFIKGKIIGWDEVSNADGEPLDFNQQNLDILFDDSEARRAVFENYQSLVTGQKQDAEKNLENSASAG